MSDAIDQEILGLLLDEASEAMQEWEQSCLLLEKDASQQNLDALFRVAHNVKGASRSVGLMELGSFVHIAEDLITLLKNDASLVNSERIGILLDSQSLLNDWIETLREDSSFNPDTKALEAKIQEAIAEIEASGGKKAETFASESELEQEVNSAQVGLQEASAPVELKSVEEIQAELAAAAAEEEKAKSEAETKKVEPEKPVVAAAPAPAPAASKKKAKKKDNASKPDKTIRVSANKLDELMQLIGELSIHQSIVSHSKQRGELETEVCGNAIYLSNKITKDLQNLTLSLRMQPVAGLFQRLERVGRDVAKAQEKDINFELEGTEVSLDKTVIERVTDPLIHVIRNAVDHGVEDNGERGEKGKATVLIGAHQDAGGVVITVKDDGKGMNPEVIFNKAVSKGLVSAEAELSNTEIYQLVLLPGFSTKEVVTDISGRGVGMDVVKQAVEELGGTIDIDSKLGSGTSFRITLPTNLSIIDALVVKIGKSNYAVPMKELVEIIDLTEHSIENSGAEGKMINLRDLIVPVERLDEYLPSVDGEDEFMAGKIEGENRAGTPALVVADGQNQLAFEVDFILGQQQIVVRPLSEQLAELPGYAGGTILGNGEPGMIINLSQMTKSYLKRTKRKGA
jgi:two-component system chemotaxis sensor kinase CheA